MDVPGDDGIDFSFGKGKPFVVAADVHFAFQAECHLQRIVMTVHRGMSDPAEFDFERTVILIYDFFMFQIEYLLDLSHSVAPLGFLAFAYQGFLLLHTLLYDKYS